MPKPKWSTATGIQLDLKYYREDREGISPEPILIEIALWIGRTLKRYRRISVHQKFISLNRYVGDNCSYLLFDGSKLRINVAGRDRHFDLADPQVFEKLKATLQENYPLEWGRHARKRRRRSQVV